MNTAKHPDRATGRRSAIRIALLLLCAAVPGAVLADPPQAAAVMPSAPIPRADASGGGRPANARSDQRSMSVSLADLDLTTAAGARTARERLHQAARRLCSELTDSLDLGHQPHFVHCVDQATARALRQLAPPALVAGDVKVARGSDKR
jgi:UrcA family protein